MHIDNIQEFLRHRSIAKKADGAQNQTEYKPIENVFLGKLSFHCRIFYQLINIFFCKAHHIIVKQHIKQSHYDIMNIHQSHAISKENNKQEKKNKNDFYYPSYSLLSMFNSFEHIDIAFKKLIFVVGFLLSERTFISVVEIKAHYHVRKSEYVWLRVRVVTAKRENLFIIPIRSRAFIDN